jgi:HAD superfamily phosphoserine phosphatase-like hydrolase
VTLAIFDLDNTLIGGDSDNLWGQFLCEQQLVESADYAQRNDQFYADYQAGQLDIDAYLRFALSALKGRSPEQLKDWHLAFMASKIAPIMLPKAAALIEDHRQRGHELLVITATNRFITEPIVKSLGIKNLIAVKEKPLTAATLESPAGSPPTTGARSSASMSG